MDLSSNCLVIESFVVESPMPPDATEYVACKTRRRYQHAYYAQTRLVQIQAQDRAYISPRKSLCIMHLH